MLSLYPDEKSLNRMTGSQYKERVKSQTLKWAMGQPYHNNIDDECCPDFSCCVPDMFEKDKAKRWQHYHTQFGNKQ